ncbi:hypothetical protein JCM19233_5971 [Vibrio astriarenae]|nr:hypothetical protein JCM19233_5971 [Vibrio sp. C7]
MVPILPQWNGPLLEFSLMYPSRKHIPLRCRKLIDFLVEYNMFRQNE